MNEFVPQISFVPFHKLAESAQTMHPVKDLSTFTLQIGEDANVLKNLQQINFFIGENNSGKSRFIRTLMKWVKTAHTATNSPQQYNYNNYEYIAPAIKKYYEIDNVFYKIFSETERKIKSYSKPKHHFILWYECYILMNEELEKQIQLILQGGADTDVVENVYKIVSNNNPYRKTKEDIKEYLQNPIKVMNVEKNTIGTIKNYLDNSVVLQPCLYIPLLRGAKLLGGDVYSNRTEKDYQLPKKDIFTGLSIYEDLKTHLLGSYEERELIKGFETLLSEHFFDKQMVTLIPKINADYVIVRIGNVEHPLHNLGDGVQALIVLLFPLYMRKNEDYYIFIEEPEMHLYPKWQRLFIKIIKAEFPKHQFFITTHSNVFINTADTSVYQVTRNHTNLISEVKHIIGNDKRGILADLGYQPSDILHANFIIWVEGISDKIYIKKFLELYDSDLKEGEDYTIMFYGGCGNLKHILVNDAKNPTKVSINQLNSNFGFIIDSDRPNANPTDADWGSEKSTFDQKEEVASICNQNNKFCWITQKRELENHISLTLWKNAFDTLQKEKNGENTPNLLAVNGETETMKYDWDYDNRFSAKNKSKPYLDPAPSDKKKIEMAEQVIKIITKSDLESDVDLHNAMTDLVNAIKAANK